MKLSSVAYLIFAVFATSTSAITAQKSVLITYPEDAPDSVLNQAMATIREAGGVITHEYKLIRGFAAKASAKALEAITTLEQNFTPYIEEDSIVSIDGDIIQNGHTD